MVSIMISYHKMNSYHEMNLFLVPEKQWRWEIKPHLLKEKTQNNLLKLG